MSSDEDVDTPALEGLRARIEGRRKARPRSIGDPALAATSETGQCAKLPVDVAAETDLADKESPRPVGAALAFVARRDLRASLEPTSRPDPGGSLPARGGANGGVADAGRVRDADSRRSISLRGFRLDRLRPPTLIFATNPWRYNSLLGE